MKSIQSILNEVWAFPSFRPFQKEVIESVLEGRDTLALMPTGGGKSLCYQVPALTKEGLCLVISPLIALMKDQVENLRKKNITAFAIYSGMSRKELINILQVAATSNCKFLYVSPERLETSLFKEYLPGLDVNLIAVDEAHCISQWGYDFRPPYLRIAALREELPAIPLLALTASATPDVQLDICEKLQFKNHQIFSQSYRRPNLSYSVFKIDSKINKVLEILSNVAGTAIVYCKSRKRTKEISDLLKMHGISADYYHAGLLQEERSRKQEDWILNKTRVIVCTNAFGMGIDKPDVRVVVHIDPPDCLENYYQEAGRVGRDGKKAYAVLLYDKTDINELDQLDAIRFPSIKEIRKVYTALANYLQIPSGYGEGKSIDFDFTDFIKKFKLNSQAVLYSIKSLEQEEWLSFSEQVFVPTTVMFVCSKQVLHDFEKENPYYEPLTKGLLRSYGGILDFPCPISEQLLARLLKKDVEEIKKQLHHMNKSGIIEYRPQKDQPQLIFLRDRVKEEELNINLKVYNARRTKFKLRTQNMIRYITETLKCRSKMITQYFGNVENERCGICDNCLAQKAVLISQEEFEKINQQINKTISEKAVRSKDLLQKLNGIKKEKAWKVIEFLQAENKIKLDNKGYVTRY